MARSISRLVLLHVNRGLAPLLSVDLHFHRVAGVQARQSLMVARVMVAGLSGPAVTSVSSARHRVGGALVDDTARIANPPDPVPRSTIVAHGSMSTRRPLAAGGRHRPMTAAVAARRPVGPPHGAADRSSVGQAVRHAPHLSPPPA